MTARAPAESIQRRSEEPPLPPGPFDVIYADPPWRYDFSRSESRSIPSHYDNLPIEDVCALPVSSASADDSVLFLWATAPKLPEALRVVERWGFRYITHAIWDKRTFGMGFWFRGAHELLLVGVHGNPPAPPASRLRESVLTAQRGAHSAKPEEFRRLIVRYTPWASRYLELFGRGRPRKGWTYWGDQAVERPGSGGRPRVYHFDREEAARLRAEGLSWGKIAKRVGASRATVQHAVERAVPNPTKSGFGAALSGGLVHPEPTRAGAEEGGGLMVPASATVEEAGTALRCGCGNLRRGGIPRMNSWEDVKKGPGRPRTFPYASLPEAERRHAAGETWAEIARRFGVNPGSFRNRMRDAHKNGALNLVRRGPTDGPSPTPEVEARALLARVWPYVRLTAPTSKEIDLCLYTNGARPGLQPTVDPPPLYIEYDGEVPTRVSTYARCNSKVIVYGLMSWRWFPRKRLSTIVHECLHTLGFDHEEGSPGRGLRAYRRVVCRALRAIPHHVRQEAKEIGDREWSRNGRWPS